MSQWLSPGRFSEGSQQRGTLTWLGVFTDYSFLRHSHPPSTPQNNFPIQTPCALKPTYIHNTYIPPHCTTQTSSGTYYYTIPHAPLTWQTQILHHTWPQTHMSQTHMWVPHTPHMHITTLYHTHNLKHILPPQHIHLPPPPGLCHHPVPQHNLRNTVTTTPCHTYISYIRNTFATSLFHIYMLYIYHHAYYTYPPHTYTIPCNTHPSQPHICHHPVLHIYNLTHLYNHPIPNIGLTYQTHI